MRKVFFLISFSFILFLFYPFSFSKAHSSSLLIVEVQINGNTSSEDFIKIYNSLENNLDISGFKLRKRTSKGTESSVRVFPQGNIIKSKDYFLWANSANNFAENLGANIAGSQTLAKNNSIALLDSENNILDALSWGESENHFGEQQSFPANPDAHQILKRKQINNIYQDTNNNGQDFYIADAGNAIEDIPPTSPPPPETSPLPSPLPSASPLPSFFPSPDPKEPFSSPPSASENIPFQEETIGYPDGIIFNEILPSPYGADEKEEWIEIFNQNKEEYDLSGWQIKDAKGKTVIFTLPRGTKISSEGFLVFSRPTTKITLNNDEDQLSLYQPDGKIADSVFYSKAVRGYSYAKSEKGWVWNSTLTPGSINVITLSQSDDKTQKESENLAQKDSEPTPESQKELASVGKQFPEKFSFSVFLIALSLALFSALAIFFLKKFLKN